MEEVFSFSLLILVPAALLVWTWFRVRVQVSQSGVRELPGPGRAPWLVGHIPSIVRAERAGDTDFSWTRAFGHTINIKGPFGRDVVFTSDPKVLHYILNSPRYKFPRSSDMRFRIQLVAGKGLAWAEGEQHARQRRVMTPAFTPNAVKSFLSIFLDTSRKAVSRWQSLIEKGKRGSLTIDVHHWLARLAMDMLGGALDYDFEALEEDGHSELMTMYKSLMPTAYYKTSNFKIAFRDLCGYLPQWMITTLQKVPGKSSKKLRHFDAIATRIASELVERQVKLMAAGQTGSNDIMSLLVKANQDGTLHNVIHSSEIVAQMRTILVAGHETVANSAAWILYELSKHPGAQVTLREEIIIARRALTEGGRQEFELRDFESMPFLVAVIKETLRFHPILSLISREASQDDILPLLFPQISKSGKTINEVFIRKGQRITISLNAYHRIPSIWGNDADAWNPQRFLGKDIGRGGSDKVSLGLLSNLLTFSSGDRSCIGWRFAYGSPSKFLVTQLTRDGSMLSMYVIVTELVEHFEFLPPPDGTEIIPVFTSLLSPMIKGAAIPRVEMPLVVKSVVA